MTNFLQLAQKAAPSQYEDVEDDSQEAIVAANITRQEVAGVSEGITTTCEKEADVNNSEDNRVFM